MTRSFGLAALAVGSLAACVHPVPEMQDFLRGELPAKYAAADRDIVGLSLRPTSDTAIARLPDPVEEPELSLRLRSDYARVQLQWPLLPRHLPMRLTAVVRSYHEPDELGAPRGTLLLRVSFPLHAAARPTDAKVGSPAGAVTAAPSAEPGALVEDEPVGAGLDELSLTLPAGMR